MDHVPSGQRALRRGRVSLARQPYLLTTVCAHRNRTFLDPDAAHAAIRGLTATDIWEDASLVAWVLMPDHWHGLVVLGARAQLSHVMRRAKAISSRNVGLATGRPPPLWQEGFHDRALRSDEDLRVAARYVVANPLRAGLVEVLAQYPFWFSAWGEEALHDPYW